MAKGRPAGYAIALAAMAAIATPIYVSHEGTKTLPYKDIVGVWTVCSGDTRNVTPGVRQTDAQCEERTKNIMSEFGEGVAKLNPTIVDYPTQWAAHTVFAANVGLGAYAKSSVLRFDKQGQHRLGCRSMLLYKKAGGKTVIGLVNRRGGTEEKIGEYELCLVDAVQRDLGNGRTS